MKERDRRAVRRDEVESLKRHGGSSARGADAFEAFEARGCVHPVTTRYGTVQFEAAALHTDGIECWLDIRLAAAGSDDPHFRIFNPPLLAEDPRGEILHGDRRYRRDPVAAVAEVIARHRSQRGGARR